ncbi:MAG: peptidoglycan-binding protein, partial [Candidatus Tectomicrobia bacterium]|nr:peptidoglycan-binding protein [Candidatus Tectomicrobia bacterium]
SGRLDRACKMWRESYQMHPYGYAVHYDLGLCEEYYTRDLQAALKYYEQADELTPKPVKAISTALNRVQRSALNEAKLKNQLSHVKPPNTPRDRVRRQPEASSQDVKLVQTKLNELGYDTGTPDGQFGPRTTSAIQEYQKDQGLAVTGEITAELLDRLKK